MIVLLSSQNRTTDFIRHHDRPEKWTFTKGKSNMVIICHLSLNVCVCVCVINPEYIQSLVIHLTVLCLTWLMKRTQNCMTITMFCSHICSSIFSQSAVFSICICVWFIQSGLGDTKSQMLPVNSSLPEQNGIRDSSSETQSQRSPDGSEDGDSSQSKCRHISYTGCYLWYVIVCSNNPWYRIRSPSRSEAEDSYSEQTALLWSGDHCTLDHSCNCRGSWQSRWIIG